MTVLPRTATLHEPRPSWMERPTVLGQLGRILVLAGIALAVLFPFYLVTVTSLSSQRALTQAGGMVLVPTELTFAAYVDILSNPIVLRALAVSIGVTVVGTAVSVTLTACAAYGLSRPGTLLHRPLLFLVLGTFLFVPGIIPSYLMVSALGLLNTYGALILPGAVVAFQLVILRGFFMGIPGELLDAARIDGASEFRIFLTIVLPLSKAVVAVIALFYGVAYWDAFFNALLYLNDSQKWPIQLVLRTYVLQGDLLPQQASAVAGTDPPPALARQMAIIVVAILPIMLVYPFVQRHFTKGVITGAVKG